MSEPQHMTALAHANGIRTRRARLMAELKEGKRTIYDIIDDYALESMTVYELVRRYPWRGPTQSKKRPNHQHKAERVCVTLGVRTNKQLKALTERQRAALLAQFPPVPEYRKR